MIVYGIPNNRSYFSSILFYCKPNNVDDCVEDFARIQSLAINKNQGTARNVNKNNFV